MKIEGLRELYKSMRHNDLSRTQFQYRHNNVTFDVMFFIDDAPFQLLFGAVGHKCSFFVDVNPGFEITMLHPKSAYTVLCKALGLKYDPANRFSTSKFFKDFSLHIPSSLSPQTATSLPVAAPAPQVDDGEKIFFSHWRNNSVKSGNVTAANLEKTHAAFGSEISTFCKKKNISSCWSDKEKKQ